MATDNDLELGDFLTKIQDLSRDKLVKLYVKTREAKATANREAEAVEARFKAIMQGCENAMLLSCSKQGDTGFATEFGTAYQAETMKISIADDAAFFDFVKASGDLDFFERRVAVKHVQEHMAQADGSAPPGLSIFKERVMRVRKAGEK